MKKAERIIALATLLIMLVTVFAGCTAKEVGESNWTPIHGDPSLKPDTAVAEEKLRAFGTYPGTLAAKDVVTVLNKIKIDDITGLWTVEEEETTDKDGNVTLMRAGYDLENGYYYYEKGPKDNLTRNYYAKQDKNYFLVQEIQWIVLEETSDSYLLIAREAIDAGRPFLDDYKQSSWAESTLRDWLNGTGDYALGGEKYAEQWNFFDRAFTPEEQNSLIAVTNKTEDNKTFGTKGGDDTTDKVFILSADEADRYLSGDIKKVATATEYAYFRGGYVMYDNRTCIWWLRDPGMATFFLAIDRDGEIGEGGHDSNDATICIRPVIRVKKDLVRNIDTTLPTSKSISTPTPKPKTTPTPKPDV